jgi:hypothetical protein
MSVRNLNELGVNLQKIVTRLMNNENLLKLLYCTTPDPLGFEFDFKQKGYNTLNEFVRGEIYEKLIRITPKVGTKDKD